MMTLVFIACLAAGDGRCQRVELPLEGGPMACIRYGQLGVADWLNRNPGYRLRGGYSCRVGETRYASL